MSYKLLIKQHKITGMRYLCVTSKSDYKGYRGSGTYWRLHLKKHGTDLDTILLLETNDKHELSDAGKYYSILYNVVESDEWANLVPEIGYDDKNENFLFWYKSISEEDKQSFINKQHDWLNHISKEDLETIYNKQSVSMKLYWSNISKSGYVLRCEQNRIHRLNLSTEKKEIRKKKLQARYATGEFDHIYERQSKERMGSGNPVAKEVKVGNITYGTVTEAAKALGIPRHQIYKGLSRGKHILEILEHELHRKTGENKNDNK